jgi:rsbT antagonist protein RsbS
VTALAPTFRTALQQLQGVLVAALPDSLTPAVLQQVRSEVLEAALRTRSRAVLLDASAVDVMDSADFRSLCETAQMCTAMGRPTILCGLSPGVVSSLVDLDVDVQAVDTARNVEAALSHLCERPR